MAAQAPDYQQEAIRQAQRIMDWWNTYSLQLQPYAMPLTVASLVLGLLVCFVGYRLFKVLLAILGLVAGVFCGIGSAWLLAPNWNLGPMVLGALGGIAGAIVAVLLYFVSVFIFGAMVALGVTGTLLVQYHLISGAQSTVHQNPWLLAIPAVLGGVLALFLQRVIIILASATWGAWTLIDSVWTLLGRKISLYNPQSLYTAISERKVQPLLDALNVPVWLAAVGLALTICGIVVQFAYTGKHHHHGPTAEPEPPAERLRPI